jgi:3-oxoacyl-[acyl-carrier protein] reductase
MKLDLSGRRAVVTGGSRGIGFDTALKFAEAGAAVSICARKADGLEKARVQLAAASSSIVHAAVCDLAEPQAIEAYIAEAAQALGGIDILVNNVTGGGTGNTEADWQKSVNIDILGTARVTRAAQPHLEAGNGSAIINVASRSAVGPAPRGQAYAAAKAAVMHLTTSQAAEMGRKGVRVNCVAPGSTEFPGGFWDKMRTRAPELYEKTAASFPFGRFGREDDISSVMLFLASPLAGWITGQTILVDGGQTLGA